MGIFFAVLSGIMVLVQGPVLRKASMRFSEEKLVIIGSALLGINFSMFIIKYYLNLWGGYFIRGWQWSYVAICLVNTFETRWNYSSRHSSRRGKQL